MDQITEYDKGCGEDGFAVCEALRAIIDRRLPAASSKLYHGAPVWFLDGNPIVGYSKKKSGIALLFWSGQSFKQSGLNAMGKFKAAEISYAGVGDIDASRIEAWLEESKTVIWNYKDLPRTDGELTPLRT